MLEQFVKERIYFKNVSPKTVIWYNCAFKAFSGALESRQTILNRVAELRGRGLSSITVNTYLRAVNAYCMWLHQEHGRELIRIPRLKEEQKILQVFTAEHVQQILSHRPHGLNNTRVHTAVCLILDTGLRIAETLSLTKADVDFDNLIIKVKGKGGKHRLIPMSLECRKILFRYSMKRDSKLKLLFGTKLDTRVTPRNFHRDFKRFGEKLGITGVRISPHTLRHSFAVGYLKRGGNLEYLRRILGHSSLITTQKYLRSLGVEDLQAVHSGLSLLTR